MLEHDENIVPDAGAEELTQDSGADVVNNGKPALNGVIHSAAIAAGVTLAAVLLLICVAAFTGPVTARLAVMKEYGVYAGLLGCAVEYDAAAGEAVLLREDGARLYAEKVKVSSGRKCLRIYDDQETVGWIVLVEAAGFGGKSSPIGLAVAVGPDGYVIKAAVKSIRENPRVRGDAFIGRFAGKSYPIWRSVNGEPNSVDVIAGATVSSNAVIEGVNEALLTAAEAMVLWESGGLNG